MCVNKLTQRRGLRIVGRNVHSEVKRACIKYAKWLRTQYVFPVRVPVYLYPKSFIKIDRGHEISATFFEPFKRDEEPYIRVATGDYRDFDHVKDRDDELATILCSISHELVHYFQWIKHGRTWERGVEKQASNMVDRYAETTDHP